MLLAPMFCFFETMTGPQEGRSTFWRMGALGKLPPSSLMLHSCRLYYQKLGRYSSSVPVLGPYCRRWYEGHQLFYPASPLENGGKFNVQVCTDLLSWSSKKKRENGF